MNLDMERRIVQVQYKNRQLHHLQVKNNVPEDCVVIFEETFFEDGMFPFLLNDVDVLFIEGERWEHLDADTILAFEVVSFILWEDCESGNEGSITDGALHSVGTEVLGKARDKLFFFENLFTLRALSVQLQEETCLKDLTELDIGRSVAIDLGI